MNKTAFMNDLSDKLDRLSEDDRKEYLEFFSEIIDDKIEEDGSNEAAAVEAMDSTENIAELTARTDTEWTTAGITSPSSCPRTSALGT